MTYYYPRNRAWSLAGRPEITASPGLRNITSAGQRPSDARARAGEKTNRPAGDLTAAGR